MKILALYKPEQHNPPTPELITRMNAFIEEMYKAGKLIATEGRKAGAPGMKIRMRKGQLSVTDGPFTEAKEIIGGWAILQAPTREEAVRISKEFMELHRKHWPGFVGESEVRPMFAPGEGP